MTTKWFHKLRSSGLRTGEECDNHQGARAINCRQEVFAGAIPPIVAPETLAHLRHSEKISWSQADVWCWGSCSNSSRGAFWTPPSSFCQPRIFLCLTFFLANVECRSMLCPSYGSQCQSVLDVTGNFYFARTPLEHSKMYTIAIGKVAFRHPYRVGQKKPLQEENRNIFMFYKSNTKLPTHAT